MTGTHWLKRGENSSDQDLLSLTDIKGEGIVRGNVQNARKSIHIVRDYQKLRQLGDTALSVALVLIPIESSTK